MKRRGAVCCIKIFEVEENFETASSFILETAGATTFHLQDNKSPDKFSNFPTKGTAREY
jgi:hypothetical protein